MDYVESKWLQNIGIEIRKTNKLLEQILEELKKQNGEVVKDV